MLKQRLIFGTLITLALTGLVLLDGLIGKWFEARLVQGMLVCILVSVVVIIAQLELARLIERTGAKVFLPIAIPASIALVNIDYILRFRVLTVYLYFFPIIFCAVFIYQAIRYGTKGTIANCGANLVSIFYLGLLSKFVVDIRLVFGVWELLMFVFVVKSADIGAYTFGKLYGRRKFSPVISPGKTWEGMGGAVIFAVAAGSIFAWSCGIMPWWLGVIFGVIFAFIGQLGDLAESMLKRDAEQKDSSQNVPGFGGVLDIIDSVLVSGPFAYLFFSFLIA